MKKIYFVILVFINSCSMPSNDLKDNKYKSYLQTNDYKISKTDQLKNKNDNYIYQIDGLIPYNQSNKAKIIKSDFSFKTESFNDLSISKVLISESGKQVDKNGTDFIVPDYSKSKKLNLTIEGNFPISGFNSRDFFFVNETNLLHLSYIGEKNLETVALIDDSIVLNPISASSKYITLSIDTKNVPDFYLKGLHKLKITSDKKSVTTMIRFGDPVKPETSLTPEITKIELLKKEKENKAMALKLTGRNFMINPQFYYTKVDGVFSQGYQSDVIKTNNGDVFETVVNISNQTTFLTKTNHVIEFYTPFGMVYSEFKI